MDVAVACRLGWVAGRPCFGCDCGAQHMPPSPPPSRCKGDTLLPCSRCEPGCAWYAAPDAQGEEIRVWNGKWGDDTFFGNADHEIEPPPPAPAILLDPYQQAAVEHEHGPALCTAGAGSGKTRVLTERISRLIYRGLARPESVLAVTFSRKAAHELRERVAQRLGEEAAERIQISTFHSLGLSICREFADKLGRNKYLSVWDERACRAEMQAAWEEVVASLPDDKQREDLARRYKNKSPTRLLLRLLDQHKREPDDLDGLWTKLGEHGQDSTLLASAAFQYEEGKRACNTLDYDDLIWLSTRLLLRDDAVRQTIQERFDFVLVDEYQDTSRLQATMMKQIAGLHRNIFVVGDDDQAIYRWRGAEPTNLLEFEQDWPNASIYPLGLNYRSTPNIVDFAARSIVRNVKRRDKRIWSESEAGVEVEVEAPFSLRSEAERSVRWLAEVIEQDGKDYRDGAILVRTRRQLLTLSAAAGRAKIPVSIVGALSWHQRADARLVLAWLRWILNPKDLEAASTILKNWPGVGPKTVVTWRQEAVAAHGDVLDAPLRKIAAQARQNVLRTSLERLVSTSWHLHALSREHVSSCVAEVYVRAGLSDGIAAQRGSADVKEALDAEARDEVRETLMALAIREPQEGIEGIRNLLDEVATISKQEREDDANGGRLTISTIHASKGLEWHAVALVGACEGVLPFQRTAAQAEEDDEDGEEGHVEDERRLFYVACTRAKKRLLITHPQTLDVPGKPSVAANPSRFIEEGRPPAPPAPPTPPRKKWSRNP